MSRHSGGGARAGDYIGRRAVARCGNSNLVVLGAHLICTKQRLGDVPLFLLLDEGQIRPMLRKHGHVVTNEMSWGGTVQHGETRHQPGADCRPAALHVGQDSSLLWREFARRANLSYDRVAVFDQGRQCTTANIAGGTKREHLHNHFVQLRLEEMGSTGS